MSEFMTNNPGSVITKMSFSQLFSKAWYRTIKPENIINGFRATGVCPLNRMAIAAHVEVSSDLSSSGEDEALQDCDYFQLQEEPPMLAKLQEETPIPPKPFFSEEQIHLFQTRFENGYNLFIDKDYVAWVNIHHPEFLPSTSGDTYISTISDEVVVEQACISTASVSETLAETRMVLSAISPQDCEGDEFDAHFGFPNNSPTETETITVADVALTVTDTTFDSVDVTNTTAVPTAVITNTSTNSTALTDITNTTPTVAVTSTTTARKIVSPLSEFLSLPKITPKRSKGGSKPGPARVLTNEQSLQLLMEKEKKKKEEEEAKERRKREREEKRKLREEENKKKAEEKQKKIEERKRKVEEKAKEQELKRSERKKKKDIEISFKEKQTTSGYNKIFTTRSKTRRDSHGQQNNDGTKNICIVCFGEYENDLSPERLPLKNWVQCTSPDCNKWMHEDCTHQNTNGNLVCLCGNEFE